MTDMELNGTEQGPEIDPDSDGPLIFYNDTKASQWRDHSFFKKWCWDYQISICKEMNLDPYCDSHTKVNLKWRINLNIVPKSIKLLEENIEERICGIKLGKDF